MRLTTLTGVAMVLAQAACLSVSQNDAATVTGHHQGCELTMQSNTLASACGELILRNTGSATMHGWQITFDLPIGDHLINTWDANFSIKANTVTVQPLPDEVDLAPDQSITLGYCANGASSNVVLTAGMCNGTAGTTALVSPSSSSPAIGSATPSNTPHSDTLPSTSAGAVGDAGQEGDVGGS